MLEIISAKGKKGIGYWTPDQNVSRDRLPALVMCRSVGQTLHPTPSCYAYLVCREIAENPRTVKS